MRGEPDNARRAGRGCLRALRAGRQAGRGSMSGLLYEIGTEATGKWAKLATLTPDDPPGSISQNTLTGRDVIMFRCAGDHSVVERSVLGADMEAGSQRAIVTAGTEGLGPLPPGETHQGGRGSGKGTPYK